MRESRDRPFLFYGLLSLHNSIRQRRQFLHRNYTEFGERILRHNQGRSKYTKSKRPWNLVYFEEHPDRSDAMKREYAIKRRKSKEYLAKLIERFNSG
jgi:putative endonuclease